MAHKQDLLRRIAAAVSLICHKQECGWWRQSSSVANVMKQVKILFWQTTLKKKKS